jgi:hypothetical protein
MTGVKKKTESRCIPIKTVLDATGIANSCRFKEADMYSDYILNQLMQEYYDRNLGEPEEEPYEVDDSDNGLSPDEEF